MNPAAFPISERASRGPQGSRRGSALAAKPNLVEVLEARLVGADEQPLTIAEAKRRLALSLGVSAHDIKITISN
jgi:hypothetical protein